MLAAVVDPDVRGEELGEGLVAAEDVGDDFSGVFVGAGLTGLEFTGCCFWRGGLGLG